MKIKDIVLKEGTAYKVVKSGPEGTQLQSPDMHTTLTLDPEASKGIVADPSNPNKYTMSPQAIAPGSDAQQTPTGPKQGSEVELPANEGQGGHHYDIETTVSNPDYNPEDDDSYDEISVGINYSISGEELPATWGYHGGSPAEHPEIDDVTVINLHTHEDITDKVDSDEIEKIIWEHEREQDNDFYDEDYTGDIGGSKDKTDQYIDDVVDKEYEKVAHGDIQRIKELMGYK